MTVKIDGAKLKIRDVVRVARPGPGGRFEKAALHPVARDKMAATRAYIDRHWMHDDAPLMYAFNTGVGLFKDQRILVGDMAEYQRKTVLAHATGVGEPFAEDTTRAMMLLRANAFASNYSGPRLELVERLVAFLNAGLHPVIPQKGSVGASGDLAPLAHMAGAVCGFEEAEIVYKGKRLPAREAIRKAGFEPDFAMGAKDASALINGSTASLALGVLAVNDARRLLKQADIALCLSLEAMRGERAAFDPRLHKARPHVGQGRVARNALRILDGTKRCSPGRAGYRLPGGKPRAGRAGAAAGAGRLQPALRPAGARAGGRGDRVRRAHPRDRDQRRDRQPPHLRRRRRRLRLDLGRPFPRPVHGAGARLPRHRRRRPRRDRGAAPRAPHRPGDELRAAAQPACREARPQHRLRHRPVLDVGARDGEPQPRDAGLGRTRSPARATPRITSRTRPGAGARRASSSRTPSRSSPASS